MAADRLVIVGAGPTGLGAAWRLRELGHQDFVVLEADDGVGGLARSFTDPAGFTYDIGGHVLFSHYPYYDRVVAAALGDDHSELQREAWVWMQGRYLPYPFQTNIRRLDPHTVYECVLGLIEAQRQPDPQPRNFREWVHAVFGAGMARHFMLPYNEKVWATPAEAMAFGWIAERVQVVDVAAVLRNVVLGEDHLSWGPNSTFRYPLRGGTGALFETVGAAVADRVELGCRVAVLDPAARVVTTTDGRRWPYQALLSTMPLDELVACAEDAPDAVRRAAGRLHASGTHVVGVGLDRPAGTTRNWVYYPEPEVPFYRVTYLSNYSPCMTARPGQTLLLTETSTSRHRPEDPATIVPRVLDGLVRVGLVDAGERDLVVTTWRRSPAKTYPVPTLDRDQALAIIEPWLAARRIWSRGRLGAWRYEIGNMDHSFMQGVEWVDHVLRGAPETVWTPAPA
jgi:protoporphyrinogen oxidase